MIIAALFLFLLGYCGYLIFPIYKAMQIADETVAKNVVYEQHPIEPESYILVAGDSSAAGVGAVDPRDSIAGRLGQRYPKADLVNLGVSGAKLSDLIEVLRAQKGHYDIVLLQIGANDVTHFTGYEKVKDGIAEVLKLAHKLGTKVVLLTSGDIGKTPIFHWPLSSVMSSRTLGVRDIFLEASAKYSNVSYLDLFYELKKNPDVKNVKEFYSPDFFHLSGNGYEVYYSYVQKALDGGKD